MLNTDAGRKVRGLLVGVCMAAAALSVQAAALVVVQVAPMTGVAASLGRAYEAGLQLALAQFNAAGGAAGNTLRLVSGDDGSRPQDTVSLTRTLVAEQRPLVLAGYFGTRGVSDLVASGLLDQEKLPLVGYRATLLRGDVPLVYSVRAGLADQVDKIMQHLSTLGIDKAGVFMEEGPQTKAVQALVADAAARRRITVVATATVPAGSGKTEPAVTALHAAAPQAILMLASEASAGFVEGYRAAGGGAQLFASSDVDVEQLARRLGDEQLAGISIAQVTPSPTRLTTRLVRDFQQALKASKNPLPASHAMLEGYINGRVIAEAVKRAGANPTRESLVKALDGMDRLDLGDYVIAFRPGEHTGSRYVDLSIVAGSGRLRQ
ncbi:ABC transporter substrate-binding protein [Xylophilus sp. ASV27]|uniref:ABC transporter substrate-binding protein n=1 Tax=Xylophilus sp. ASV27 TaxID=2795129 RepID=UPI0018EA39AA|nr:ABC transporter substrate-binding protein [Xylophilus sp. ASV27]